MPLVVPYSTHHLHQFHLSIISFLFIEQHQLPCPSAVFPPLLHISSFFLCSLRRLSWFSFTSNTTPSSSFIIVVPSCLPTGWRDHQHHHHRHVLLLLSNGCAAASFVHEIHHLLLLCAVCFWLLHLMCWCYHRRSLLQLLHRLPCSVSIRPPLQLLFAVAGGNRWAREDQHRDSCSSFFFASLPESRNRLSSSFSLAVILIISSFSSSFFLLLLPLLGVAVAVTISSSYPSSSVLAAASFSSSSSREAVASSWGPEPGGRCCIVLLLPLFLVTPHCCHCGHRCWAVCRPCCGRCCCCCSCCSCCQTPFPATEPRKSLLSLPWTSVLGRLCLSLVFG